jgi:lysine 2,3-aminomutase
VLRHRPDLAALWASADALFPVRITRSWWSRVNPADPDDPLGRQALPDAAELAPHPEDLEDPVGDAARSPLPWVVHKYPDRVLLLVTKRCHLYCRYCFRRTFDPADDEDPSPEAWEAALAYATSCGATEAILSGGDPLAVRDGHLLDALDRLRAGGVHRLRIHTRAPITAPARVTPALAAALGARAPLRVVVHVNHPRELSDEVRVALGRLRDAGVELLDQTVLLAGVNDDARVLAELVRALHALGVRPYYLHHPDAAAGNAGFRVPVARGLAIHEALSGEVGRLAPRYVVDPPDGSGKIDVARWSEAGRRGT